MFWSLDRLFQARESNMFQMAYKYMYKVNNEFQVSREEGGGGGVLASGPTIKNILKSEFRFQVS